MSAKVKQQNSDTKVDDTKDDVTSSSSSKLDSNAVEEYIENSWKDSVLDTLKTYITINNQSPDYDADIHTNGLQEKACKLLTDWVKKQNVKGLKMQVLQDPKKTPLIFIEIDGTTTEDNKHTVLMYGHFGVFFYYFGLYRYING